MKYAILNFNQQSVIDLNEDIDMEDLLLLDYVYNAIASPSMFHIVEDNIVYVWLQHDKILQDLPILNVSRDRLKRRIKKLVDIQLLKTKQVYDTGIRGSKAYYSITSKCEGLRYTGVKNNTRSEEQVLKTTPDSAGTGVKNNTSYNKLNLISKDISNIDSKLKDNSQKLVELYHRHCYNLPKVRAITDKRKKAIERLCKKHDINEITTAFDLANSSDFLMGNNDRGWKADLDFILREDKFVSILEGKYCNRKNQTLSQRINESGTSNVPTFTDKDQEKLKEFQEQLRKDGKQIYF